MGFLDSILGGKRKLEQPAEDRLFAMTTANVHIETALGLKHRSRAAIVFQPLATADFTAIVTETEELLRSAASDSGTAVETADDEFGYRWLILRDDDFDDLVVALNTISVQLQGGGYGDRILAAVFVYEERDRPLYLIYNFKRGKYYPFVPGAGKHTRDTEREMQLKAQIGVELPFEEDMARWFPLWEIPL